MEDRIEGVSRYAWSLLEYHIMLVKFASNVSHFYDFVPCLPDDFQALALELEEICKFCFSFPSNRDVKRTWLSHALVPGTDTVSVDQVFAGYYQQYDSIWEPIDSSRSHLNKRSEFERGLSQRDMPDLDVSTSLMHTSGWKDAEFVPAKGSEAVRTMMRYKHEGLTLVGLRSPLFPRK